MANFVVIVDPDAGRRAEFLERAGGQVAPLPGLLVGHAESEGFAATWAAARSAPVSHAADERGAAVVIGDAIDGDGKRRDASALRKSWGGSLPGAIEPADGYFAAAVYETPSRLKLMGDVLGMFPLYYWQRGEVLLAGSSIELFRCHPLFELRLSRRGLAGILLANGLVADQTLAEGVKRVARGHMLGYEPRRGAREQRVYRLERESDPGRPGDEELMETAEDALVRALARHAPAGSDGTMLLSGGLDSRLLSGWLARADRRPTPVCRGVPSDMDMEAAGRVASELGWELVCEEQELCPEAAERAVQWEYLAGGFSGMEKWRGGSALAETPAGCWSGIGLEDMLGGYGHLWGIDLENMEYGFESALKRTVRWAIDGPTLARLLVPLGGQRLVDETVEALRDDFWNDEEPPEVLSLRCKLGTRVRNHQGAALWRYSFENWPLFAVFDRRFMEACAGLDARSLLHRRLQRELLRRRFPALARIPLDGNDWRFRAPAGNPRAGRWRRLRERVTSSRHWQRFYWQRLRGVERRRFVRLYDINGPAWQALRERAEPVKRRVEGLLDRETLDELLPPPGARIRCKDLFGQGSRARLLVGFLLWAEERV